MQKLRKKSLVLCAGLGIACAVMLTMLLCLPLAAAMTRGMLPLETAGLWAMLSAGASVFAASLFIASVRRRQALPAAAVIAGGFLLLCALLCAGGGDEAAFGPWLWELAAAVCAGGLLGAVMSIRQNDHKKKRKTRR